MIGRIIDGPDDLAEGAAWLVAQDARWGPVLSAAGPLPLRREAEGFEALLTAITGQQVSVASARAIGGRLRAAGLTTPDAVSAGGEAALRDCGLSRPKMRYALALAGAQVDWAALRSLPDAQVAARLVELPGIGRWTAEIYAMFSLGRADVLAAGDLALQEGARLAFGLAQRPSERDLRALAEGWSPWRAVAARALWAYYRVAKGREGVAG